MYSINPTGGTNPLLGCRKVSVPTPAQTAATATTTTTTTTTAATTAVAVAHLAGVLNPVTKSDAGATSTLSGWVVDYGASTTAAAVHVYIDNTLIATGSANGTGGTYSIAVAAPTAAGTHYACVYAIHPYGGNNPLLGCRKLIV